MGRGGGGVGLRPRPRGGWMEKGGGSWVPAGLLCEAEQLVGAAESALQEGRGGREAGADDEGHATKPRTMHARRGEGSQRPAASEPPKRAPCMAQANRLGDNQFPPPHHAPSIFLPRAHWGQPDVSRMERSPSPNLTRQQQTWPAWMCKMWSWTQSKGRRMEEALSQSLSCPVHECKASPANGGSSCAEPVAPMHFSHGNSLWTRQHHDRRCNGACSKVAPGDMP